MRTLLIVFLATGLLSYSVTRKVSPPAADTVNHTVYTDSLFDERDSSWYEVIRIDTLYWFNTNLSFKTPGSKQIHSDYANGRLYAYADARLACPKGWRLPTVAEFDQLMRIAFDPSFTGLTYLPYNWQTINQNPAKLRFQQTGFLHKRRFLSAQSFNIWLDQTNPEEAYHVHMYDTHPQDSKRDLTIFRHTHQKHKPKKNRKFAARCVCEVKPN